VFFGFLPEVAGYVKNGGMDKTIRKYTSFDDMKADEYRYWQSRPVHDEPQRPLRRLAQVDQSAGCAIIVRSNLGRLDGSTKIAERRPLSFC
jgi:hypothetical protein